MIRANIRQNIQLFDEYGVIINHYRSEKKEQFAALKHIKPQDKVLELGARYGSVSCVIDKILIDGSNLVSVEPDETVWRCLARNRDINDCKFRIVEGLISKKLFSLQRNGYGTTTYSDVNSKIPHFEIDQIEEKFNMKFNVLVADCEGCLNQFIKENLKFVSELSTVMFEKDYDNKCDYGEIHKILEDFGFTRVEDKFIKVYKK
jgi:FkbM family methyltransferase